MRRSVMRARLAVSNRGMWQPTARPMIPVLNWPAAAAAAAVAALRVSADPFRSLLPCGAAPTRARLAIRPLATGRDGAKNPRTEVPTTNVDFDWIVGELGDALILHEWFVKPGSRVAAGDRLGRAKIDARSTFRPHFIHLWSQFAGEIASIRVEPNCRFWRRQVCLTMRVDPGALTLDDIDALDDLSRTGGVP